MNSSQTSIQPIPKYLDIDTVTRVESNTDTDTSINFHTDTNTDTGKSHIPIILPKEYQKNSDTATRRIPEDSYKFLLLPDVLLIP